ncbi:MAG: CHASE4 domain-containing protein, partial [Planctomycetota bacterium]
MAKLGIAVTVVTGLALLGFYFLSQHVLLQQFDELDHQTAKAKLARLQKAVEYRIQSIDKVVIDWAQWDDTYQYMLDKNQAYERSNLTETIFLNQPLNLVAFFTPQGKCFKFVGYDLQASSFNGPNPSLIQHFEDSPLIWTHADEKSSATGILQT